MAGRTAQSRQEHAAFVDADSAFGAAPAPRPRARKPRAIPPGDAPVAPTVHRAAAADDPDERATAPRIPARAKAPVQRAADGDDNSSPRRSSPRRRGADATPLDSRTASSAGHQGSPSQESDPGESQPGAVPSARALVPAHRITRKETSLVARQTQRLPGLAQTTTTKAVTVVSAGGRETTVLPAPRRPLAVRALPVFAPASAIGRRRHPLARILFGIAAVAVLGGGLYTVSPLSPIRSHDSPFAPSAALLALNPENQTSGGPWDTSAGTASLGLGGGAGPGQSAPGSAGLPVTGSYGSWDFSDSPGSVFISAAPVSPWPPGDPFMQVPGHPAFRVSDANGFYPGAFGQCTWWAAFQRRDENLSYLGDAHYWASGAQARGYRVGVKAAPNATVVFRPGVEGAGGAGHVAHVEAVYPDGWFLISEMNFYWNGGGYRRVDYRFAYERPGVAFIY